MIRCHSSRSWRCSPGALWPSVWRGERPRGVGAVNDGLHPTLKVLAIASSGSLGGAELSLAEFLLWRPPRVQVEALLVGDGPLRERLTEQGVSTRVLRGHEGRPTARGLARFTRSLLRVLREA